MGLWDSIKTSVREKKWVKGAALAIVILVILAIISFAVGWSWWIGTLLFILAGLTVAGSVLRIKYSAGADALSAVYNTVT